MHVLCRPVTLPDLPNVVALDHRCFGGLWNEAAYSREIDSPNSDLLVLEVTIDGTPYIVSIGCLWAILDEAHITILGVDPRYQQRGLGRWLLTHLLKAASDRGLTHATLEVRQSNQVAIALYQSLGFRVAGERRRYYADDESALILWRSELQSPTWRAELSTQQQQLGQRLQQVSLTDPQHR
ncbi:MAG: ribosomal protein S18-alanine N-acetyltransferase [Cyanobacteria bacterium P01_H01_bin.152]